MDLFHARILQIQFLNHLALTISFLNSYFFLSTSLITIFKPLLHLYLQPNPLQLEVFSIPPVSILVLPCSYWLVLLKCYLGNLPSTLNKPWLLSFCVPSYAQPPHVSPVLFYMYDLEVEELEIAFMGQQAQHGASWKADMLTSQVQ